MPPVVTEDEAETLAPPRVEPVPSRAGAAASLLAASPATSRYVPPSVAPPAPRPLGMQEAAPSSRAHSLIPVAQSVPPPPVSATPRRRTGLLLAAAVASLAVFGGLGFAVMKGGTALGLGKATTGGLAVTAAGPSGAKVDGLRVFVDGVVKCESAPCRVQGLNTGTHFVSADAPGFTATAARAVSVERGAEATMHIDLVPQNGQSTPSAKVDEPKPEATADSQATAVSDLKAEAKPEPAAVATRTSAQKADKASTKSKDEAKKTDEPKKADVADATGMGTLNINSIPVANVVLDGRPMGSTPLVGIKVSAGPHSVVFIHPEQGRKASGTTVKAGGTATVAVRF